MQVDTNADRDVPELSQLGRGPAKPSSCWRKQDVVIIPGSHHVTEEARQSSRPDLRSLRFGERWIRKFVEVLSSKLQATEPKASG